LPAQFYHALSRDFELMISGQRMMAKPEKKHVHEPEQAVSAR